MSQTIGEVSINLRMSLASFKQDVKNGTKAASDASKGMADAVGGSSREAKASLALIGEEIGVSIPRHIRGFIAAMPGATAALSAAFSAVAVIALIKVVAEVIEKIKKFREGLEQTAAGASRLGDSMNKTRLETQAALDELQAKLIGINRGALAEMEYKLAHVHELLQSAKLGDELKATLDAAAKNFDKGILTPGGGAAADELKKFQESLHDVLTQEGRPAALEAVGDEIEKVNAKIDELKKHTYEGGTVVANQIVSYQRYALALGAIQASLDGSLSVSAKQRQVDEAAVQKERVKEETDANSKIVEARKQLNSLLNQTATALGKDSASPYDKEIQKLNELIEGWTDYKFTWESAHKGISAVANDQVNQLRKEIELLKAEADSAIDTAIKLANQKSSVDTGKLIANSVPLPVYSGTKQAEELYKISHSSAEAQREAQAVYEATRNSTERYAAEIEKLNLLLKEGEISQQTYNRAVQEAKLKYDEVAKSTRQFGADVFDAIKTGALFGSSWQNVLETLGIELAQLILKMTLFKNLAATAGPGGSGGGGFFSQLLGGFFGGFKATGGPVYQGNSYVVGEHGPELWTPDTSGRLVPNNQLKSGGSSGGDKPVVQQFHMTVNGVQDVDSFRKNQGQISADMLALMAAAHKRNR
jgi:hypothetical protein